MSFCSKTVITLAILCILGSLLLRCQAVSSESKTGQDTLFLRFQEPPLAARPRGFWDWTNGNFDLDRITYDLEEAKRKGMGGFDIWDVGLIVDPDSVVPAGPPFLSEASVQGIAHAVREANRLGMELGLVVSSSWNAGGHWIKPEHGVMGLFRTSVQVEGPGQKTVELPFPELPDRYGNRRRTLIEYDESGLPTFYKEVAVLAVPLKADSIIDSTREIIDLSENLEPDGTLIWEVPAGNWSVTRFVCAPTGQPLMLPSPNSVGRMVDHFSADAMRAHLEVFFTRLEKELGSLENQSLRYLYTDSYEANSAAWTPSLPAFFQERRGYDLTPYLPVLEGFILKDSVTSERFVHDFKKTLSDLIIENHYQLGTELCAEHGLGFYAEAGGPGPPVHNVPFEDLRALGSLTVPRGEFWNKKPDLERLQVVKNIASAAHIYNQRYVEAESFTSVWLWQEGPSELKPLADRAMAEGLNRFIYHTFPHIPLDAGTPGWVYNFGTLIYPERIWWEKSKPFHYYLSRSCYLLQQGNFVGDVAYYYGDQAPNFVPPKAIPASLGWGYDYDAINTEIILERWKVEGNRWVLPHGQSYALLVLPQDDRMNVAVLEKLALGVRQGGALLGDPPARTYGLHQFEEEEKRLRELVDELWGSFGEETSGMRKVGKGLVAWNVPEREVLEKLEVSPDVTLAPISGTPNLDFIHRQIQDTDLYFIRNLDSATSTSLVGFRHTRHAPEFWHPDRGTRTTTPVYRKLQNHTQVPITLGPQGSVFVVFRRENQEPMNEAEFDQVRKDLLSGVSMDLLSGQLTRRQRVKQINGPWQLNFAPGQGTPPQLIIDSLISWTELTHEEARHYSGKVIYETTFQWDRPDDRKYRLELGAFKEICQVYLNGMDLGIVWHPSQELEISAYLRPGSNRLTIEVVNNYNNALVADARRPEEYRQLKSNINKLPTAWTTPMAQAPLQASGLLGPVRIHALKPVP